MMPAASQKIRVLIVDDSAVVRRLLTELLSEDPLIEVVGTASDPFIARDKIKQLNPDVLTLDVEMPRMDGLTFLRNLMRLRAMPVVMVSSLTETGADVTLQALEIGAVDFVTKPKIDVAHKLAEYAEELLAKVKQAARVPVRAREPKVRAVAPKLSADAVLERDTSRRMYKTTDRVLAIGASTGGTEAIREVLEGFPADAPGTVVTQHFPAGFSGPFARRLNDLLDVRVCEAEDGQQILAGHVYIAPGGRHLMVQRSGARYVCQLSDGPPVNRHRPAVDVMFRSLAQCAGPNTVAALLTGMGDDGARGLLELRESGAATVAQDQASSVVWGMPGAAVKLGAAQEVVTLGAVAQRLLRFANDR